MGRPMISLIGHIYGKLTVIEHEPDLGLEFWRCKCECGEEIIVKRAHLRAGNTKSCGCLRRDDLTNQKFGRLTALKYDAGQKKWHCLCQCGRDLWVSPAHLKNGLTQSCGCYQKDRARETQLKHGKAHTKVFYAWSHMKDRCLNPNNKHYASYGGRNITICDRWLDFNNFLTDMGEPVEGPERISLDRIDNDGNYEPGNCRWANQKTQNNNKRNSKFYTHEGQTHTLPEWAEIKGVSYGQLRQRIYQRGWSFEEAITTPARYSPTLQNDEHIKRK